MCCGSDRGADNREWSRGIGSRHGAQARLIHIDVSRAGMSRADLSTGAFKKYRSLWQPDWGRQRRRSGSYIQVRI